MTDLPAAFRDSTLALWGHDEGAAWLERLPSLLAACEVDWDITVEPPFPDLSINYVAPALSADRTEVVLKVCFPHPELYTELDALTLYNGDGMVRLLAAHRERGAMLLERLRPGATLHALPEEEAVPLAAQILKRLWRPAPPSHAFPTMTEWADRAFSVLRALHGGTGPLPARHVERAEAIFRAYAADSRDDRLLHGDFHHGNLLSATREPWIAIDPKGVIGHPVFDLGQYLLNHTDRATTPEAMKRLQSRRIALFAEYLGYDRATLRDAGFARVVLSHAWTAEDPNADMTEANALTEALLEIAYPGG